ncbi:hypothetical protein ACHWQZ_G006314 [Mnemiopsis leidyi]
MVVTSSNTVECTYNQLKTKHHGVLINKNWISRILASEPLTVEQVYKKWLTTDIVETEGNCLPPDITSVTGGKVEIPGPLTLQVQSVLNVGLSFYSQLKKLNGKAVPEPTQQTQYNEPPPSRMLFITLTDGTNIVNGMEYKPCPQLSVNLLPGTKVLVSHVVARIGVILLQPGNFKVLGGCVERLRSLNTQEKVLKKALEGEDEGEEEEEDNDDDVVLVSDQTDQSSSATACVTLNPYNSSPAILHGQNQIKQFGKSSISTANYNPYTASLASSSAKQNAVKQSVSQEHQQATPSVFLRPPATKNCVKRDAMSNQNQSSLQNEQHSSASHSNKRIKSDPSLNNKFRKEDCNLDNDFEEFFEPDEDFEMSLDIPQISTNAAPETHNHSIPVCSLSTNLTFPLKITATISSLASKLLPVPEWTAQALLTDHSGTKELRLSEKFLCRLIGYTSAEFKQLKPVSATNQAIRTFLRTGLESCQSDLVFKTGQFIVQLNTVNSELSPFEIVEFESVDETQENELREYVKGRVEGPLQ